MADQNLIGRRFTRCDVLALVDNPRSRVWLCRCRECKKLFEAREKDLLALKVVSCGCWEPADRQRAKRQADRQRIALLRSQHPKLWRWWSGNRRRMVKAWARSFERVLRDMGSQPSHKHRIVRRDPKGLHSPANTRWSNHYQPHMRYPGRLVLFRGKIIRSRTFVNMTGISPAFLTYVMHHVMRIKNGDQCFAEWERLMFARLNGDRSTVGLRRYLPMPEDEPDLFAEFRRKHGL